MYENRIGFTGEPLGDYAFNLISFIKSKHNTIIITDVIIRELNVYYAMEEINNKLRFFERLIERKNVTAEQLIEARKISLEREAPEGDEIHAIFARDNNLILITRDNHFRKVEDISIHYKPEQII